MEAVGFSIGNKGYIGTGGNYMSGNVLLTDFWEYDPITYQWTQRPNFGGTGRSMAVGFSAGGKGYIGMGGDFSSIAYPDFWEYDPITYQWTQRANFGGTSRWLSTGFGIGTNGYISTGGNFTPTYKDLWEYTPTPTGVNQLNNQMSIAIFPNPSDKIISVSMNEFINSNSNVRILLWNSLGEIVKEESLKQNSNIIDVNNLNSGIYFYQILDNQDMLTQGKLTVLH